ncbi:MAG: transcription antitermination factor NusB [Planctomycetes bacterium]|nr:transcription antitermination factor NusB [Planctomycetota bacterium]
MSEPINQNQDYRTVARQAALQFLYQLEVQKGENLDQIETFLDEYCDSPQARQRATELIKGTWVQVKTIDKLIASASTHWNLERINPVDLSNLRLGVYQLCYCPQIPPMAVINESVELAKQFSTSQAYGFINGILDTIRRNQQDEKVCHK